MIKKFFWLLLLLPTVAMVKASFSTKPMLAEIARNYREKLIGWLNDQKIRTALGGAPVESSTPATTP
jgi:hypothetical protein